MGPLVSAGVFVITASRADDVEVTTNTTELPLVVQIGALSLHMTDDAATALVDSLIEVMTERQSYAPF